MCKHDIFIISIKRVFSIISSCINDKQLETCKTIANVYSRMAKSKGVINWESIKESIYVKIMEKREELELVEGFIN
jgi:hypothetical protein